jgi:hypothetical protein
MKLYVCGSLCLYYVLGVGCDRQKVEAALYVYTLPNKNQAA